MGVLAMISLSCGVIGPFLVLKKMTMFANALSHTILLGIVSSFLLTSFLWGGSLFDSSTLLFGSLAAAFLTALCTEGFVRFFHLQEDASVGLVFSTLFSLGVLLVTLFTRNIHLSIEAVTGNVDALSWADFCFSFHLAFLNLAIVLIFYRPLQITSFDCHYAKTLGIHSDRFRFLLLCQTAFVCVVAFRAVGVFLVLAFLVGPYLTARLFTHRLHKLLILTPIIGILASLAGVAVARHILSVYAVPLSTGGIVVCMIGLFFAGSFGVKNLLYHRYRRIFVCENG